MEFKILLWIILITLFKSLTIGCEFNFFTWLKHGKMYTRWYFGRWTFKKWLAQNKENKE